MLEHCVEQSNAYFATHDVMNKIRAGCLPGFPASPAHGAPQKNAGLGAFCPLHGAHGKALFSCYF